MAGNGLKVCSLVSSNIRAPPFLKPRCRPPLFLSFPVFRLSGLCRGSQPEAAVGCIGLAVCICLVGCIGYVGFVGLMSGFLLEDIIGPAPCLSYSFKDSFVQEILEFTKNRSIREACNPLVFLVRNPPVNFYMRDGFHLPLIQTEPDQHLRRQPVPPQGYHPLASPLLEVRLRKSGGSAAIDHIEGAGSGLLDIADEIKRLGNEGIAWDRGVRLSKQYPE